MFVNCPPGGMFPHRSLHQLKVRSRLTGPGSSRSRLVHSLTHTVGRLCGRLLRFALDSSLDTLPEAVRFAHGGLPEAECAVF